MVRTYSNPGDIILDNTCGSDSFLVAALLEGRNFIGVEKNDDSELFKKEKINFIEVCKLRLKEAWNSIDDETKDNIAFVNLIQEFSDIDS